MAEYIDKTILTENMNICLTDLCRQYGQSDLFVCGYRAALCAAEAAPAADVVEVVRCKSCKHAEKIREEERSIYKKDVVVCSRCLTLDNKRPGDWYCPEGEKMDGGGDGNDRP